MRQPLPRNFKFLLFLLLIPSILPAAWAQELPVQGRVTGAAGEGLPGVAVLEKGTSNATATDVSGRYSLSVSGSTAVLVVSYTGYQTREIAVNHQTVIELALAPKEEHVPIGYGTQPKAALSGAVATLPGEAMLTSPAFNVTNNLAGRLPGLMAIATGSEPGNDGATLRVRGSKLFGLVWLLACQACGR